MSRTEKLIARVLGELDQGGVAFHGSIVLNGDGFQLQLIVGKGDYAKVWEDGTHVRNVDVPEGKKNIEENELDCSTEEDSRIIKQIEERNELRAELEPEYENTDAYRDSPYRRPAGQ